MSRKPLLYNGFIIPRCRPGSCPLRSICTMSGGGCSSSLSPLPCRAVIGYPSFYGAHNFLPFPVHGLYERSGAFHAHHGILCKNDF